MATDRCAVPFADASRIPSTSRVATVTPTTTVTQVGGCVINGDPRNGVVALSSGVVSPNSAGCDA